MNLLDGAERHRLAGWGNRAVLTQPEPAAVSIPEALAAQMARTPDAWSMAAVIEVTDQPHTGCSKFVARFGVDAMKFVNSPLGRELCLRGINAKVVRPGTIRPGDVVRKIG